MKLKKFNTRIFAGLNDQEIQFADGLNVLLGPNEAGKSTIINGIFATLFNDPKLKKGTKKDKEFNHKFLPHPDGEYIHGNLIIDDSGDSYRIEKEWSRNNPSALLELPTGSLIDDLNKIENTLKEILLYGESTYENIVFVKQSEVKAAVKRIAENSEVRSTVNNFLRKAVMEMDGIVTAEIKEKIETEKKELLAKWDLDKHQPENTDRDLNNPYKVGTGKIYDAYIERERVKQEIRQAESGEEKLQRINQELETLEADLKTAIEKLNELSEIEEDINQRIELEPELERKEEKLADLNRIATEWPELNQKITDQNKKLEEYNKKLEQLKQEKADYEKLMKKEELEDRLDKIAELNSKLEELNIEKEKFTEIDEAKAEELADLETKISKIDAQLSASKLKAKIIRSASSAKVVRGVGAEEEVAAGSEIEADGFLRIYNKDIDIEVSSAEIDFEELKADYDSATKKYNKMLTELEELDISNSKEARAKVKLKNELLRDIDQAQKEQANLLDSKSLEDLKEEYAEIEVADDIQELEEIEKEIEKLKDDKISDLKVDLKTNQNKIAEWKKEYKSLEELESEIESLETEIKKIKQKLLGLAELPEEFETKDQFRQELKRLRKEKEEMTQAQNQKNQELLEIQDTMPAESLEELKEALVNQERKFNTLEDRAWRLLKVETAFSETLAEMDEKSFEPLITSFSSYLNTLTAGNYQASTINDDFEIEISKKAADRKMPVNLNILSFGTYDSVALALRFALYENLFADKPGFIILDDCLVNLDPERTEKAIELIKNFKDKYQIIFSTCNPETAERLGGNLIELYK